MVDIRRIVVMEPRKMLTRNYVMRHRGIGVVLEEAELVACHRALPLIYDYVRCNNFINTQHLAQDIIETTTYYDISPGYDRFTHDLMDFIDSVLAEMDYSHLGVNLLNSKPGYISSITVLDLNTVVVQLHSIKL